MSSALLTEQNSGKGIKRPNPPLHCIETIDIIGKIKLIATTVT